MEASYTLLESLLIKDEEKYVCFGLCHHTAAPGAMASAAAAVPFLRAAALGHLMAKP